MEVEEVAKLLFQLHVMDSGLREGWEVAEVRVEVDFQLHVMDSSSTKLLPLNLYCCKAFNSM